MKLAQYYLGGHIRLGCIMGDVLNPLRFPGDLMEYLMAGAQPELSSDPSIALNEVRWASPVSRPSKVMAIGLNYRDHADESKGTCHASGVRQIPQQHHWPRGFDHVERGSDPKGGL